MLPSTYNARLHRNFVPSIFNEFFNDDLWNVTPAKQFASPAVNIVENEKDFQVEIAAPGMSKEEFKVRLENDNELVIALEKEEEHKDEKQKKNYLRREFSYASYHQTFIIPEEVDIDKISASMADGILSVTLPKKEVVVKTPATRQIEIF